MRVLLLTMYAPHGGVPATARIIASALKALGHDVTIAFSVYRTAWPELSVRPWQIATHRPGVAEVEYLDERAFAVGAYLPEFEWSRYLPHRRWRELMAQFDAYVGVMGSVLPALVYAASGQRALCWVGTPYEADRAERLRRYPWARRLIDRLLELPICRHLERYVLRRVDVITVSPYTASALKEIEPQARVRGVLQPPVDLARFQPGPRRSAPPFRVGFVGRLDDPRKNVELLVLAMAELRRRGVKAEAYLLGGAPPAAVSDLIAKHNLADAVSIYPFASEDDLVSFYRSLDVFVIPSHQEGLAVVGLEAMACGVPVVATRCGGPSAYVVEGETGFQVDFDPVEMADRIQTLLETPGLLQQMGVAARARVERHNAPEVFRAALAGYLEQTQAEVSRRSGGAR